MFRSVWVPDKFFLNSFHFVVGSEIENKLTTIITDANVYFIQFDMARKNTKSLILKHALELFNDRGYFSVSTHDIALSVQISQGNLTYHFPRKEIILDELWKLHIQDIDRNPTQVDSDDYPFEMIIPAFRHVLLSIKNYRFLYIDKVRLFSEYPAFNKRVIAYTKDDSKRSEQLIAYRTDKGYFLSLKDRVSPKVIATIMYYIRNYWVQDVLIRGLKLDMNGIDYYVQLFLDLILPYFKPHYR